MEKEIYFESVKELVNWLIDNEGVVLSDFYGRRWMYSKFTFRFSDLGEKLFEENILDCLHLYGQGFKYFGV